MIWAKNCYICYSVGVQSIQDVTNYGSPLKEILLMINFNSTVKKKKKKKKKNHYIDYILNMLDEEKKWIDRLVFHYYVNGARLISRHKSKLLL